MEIRNLRKFTQSLSLRSLVKQVPSSLTDSYFLKNVFSLCLDFSRWQWKERAA